MSAPRDYPECPSPPLTLILMGGSPLLTLLPYRSPRSYLQQSNSVPVPLCMALPAAPSLFKHYKGGLRTGTGVSDINY